MSFLPAKLKAFGSRIKDTFSVTNIIGTLINVVVVLKIAEFLRNRDFNGLAGKAADVYGKTETDLIDAVTTLSHWPTLRTFLTFNLDAIIISALLLFMSLRSSITLMKRGNIRNPNSDKINDTITIAFFVTFASCALILLNMARGCATSSDCDIVSHSTLDQGLQPTQIYAVGLLFIVANLVGVPILFFVNKVKFDLRVILAVYGSILVHLVIFATVTAFTLVVAGV